MESAVNVGAGTLFPANAARGNRAPWKSRPGNSDPRDPKEKHGKIIANSIF